MPKVTAAHSAARRQQIIDAAYRCFARKGFHQTTMREIYTEADLSPGAVYNYFDSKDAIIQASFEFDRERSHALFESAIQSEDPLVGLHKLIDFLFQGLEGAALLNAPRVNVQGWGEALVNPVLLETVRQVLDDYLDALTQIIQRAQTTGQIIPSLDPQSVGRVLLSLYYGFELQLALYDNVEKEPYVTAIQALLFPNAEPK